MTRFVGHRHVVLDRDGVLNREREQPIRSALDWEWEHGALDGLRYLAAAQVVVSIATNQSAIGSGRLLSEDLTLLHDWLAQQLRALDVELGGIYVCPHVAADRCSCRKPSPGLVLQAMSAHGFSPAETVVIGDARRDIDAGRAAGTDVALLRTGKGASPEPGIPRDTDVYDDLAAAVRTLFPTHR